MVVDLPPLLPLCPHHVYPGVDQHLNEGDDLCEDKPDVNHLDVCRLRQTLGDAYEESDENQQGSQVYRDNRLQCTR